MSVCDLFYLCPFAFRENQQQLKDDIADMITKILQKRETEGFRSREIKRVASYRTGTLEYLQLASTENSATYL